MYSTLSTMFSSLPPLREFTPPTPETYMISLKIFQYFPIVSIIQWLTSFHPAGKTSFQRAWLNFPGKLGWFTMEIVGPANLCYILWKSSAIVSLSSLPFANKLIIALYLTHYLNRAIISPFFVAPSMSPIHLFVVAMAVTFNWFNSTCIAGWALGYHAPIVGHPTVVDDASSFLETPTITTTTTTTSSSTTTNASSLPCIVGITLFILGMLTNIRAETTLFRLRREEAESRAAKKSDDPDVAGSGRQSKYSKVYVIPPCRGLFRTILYPHYVGEWLEWVGFALVGSAVYPFSFPSSPASSAVVGNVAPESLQLAPWLVPFAVLAQRWEFPLPLPAVVFVVNAVTNMLPHARWGRKWYVQKFGQEAVAGRGAVVPFVSWI
ncbi:hypothetical protein FE257_002238 [Aspergillus nanangensis]|uniref:3-oxo-5-alpha-steroid 4-dehydrogenase C-terminal domain-containing protein n=1 Tax=Aspergillus nanangensis TaxID=2582783 RepID=A0AAD4CCZ8_ASPNN|nr:hypothetical protein FE257_002238 [Aspergillus nanangensis]